MSAVKWGEPLSLYLICDVVDSIPAANNWGPFITGLSGIYKSYVKEDFFRGDTIIIMAGVAMMIIIIWELEEMDLRWDNIYWYVLYILTIHIHFRAHFVLSIQNEMPNRKLTNSFSLSISTRRSSSPMNVPKPKDVPGIWNISPASNVTNNWEANDT